MRNKTHSSPQLPRKLCNNTFCPRRIFATKTPLVLFFFFWSHLVTKQQHQHESKCDGSECAETKRKLRLMDTSGKRKTKGFRRSNAPHRSVVLLISTGRVDFFIFFFKLVYYISIKPYNMIGFPTRKKKRKRKKEKKKRETIPTQVKHLL